MSKKLIGDKPKNPSDKYVSLAKENGKQVGKPRAKSGDKQAKA